MRIARTIASLSFAVTCASGGAAHAADAVAGANAAIAIARNVCPLDAYEVSPRGRWHAERGGASWRAWFDNPGYRTPVQVWVRARDGRAAPCQFCAHLAPGDGNVCERPDKGRPKGW